jgi:hypothetical protein
MLLAKRLDAFIQQVDLTYYQMGKYLSPGQISKITHNSRILHQFTLHLVLSKKNKRNAKRIELFSQDLRIIKQNGIFHSHMNRYKNLLSSKLK